MKTLRNTAIILSSKIFLFVLNFAKSVLIHRLLGPFGKGQFALITQIPKLLTTLGSLGVGVSTLYYTGKKKDKLADIVSTSLVLAIVLGLILIGLLFFIYNFLPDSLLRGLELNQILVAGLIIPFSLVNIINSSILLGSDRTKKAAGLWILAPSAFLLYLVFFNVILKEGVMGVVSALVLSIITVTALSLFFINQQVKIQLKFNVGFFKRSIIYGLKAHLGNCAQFLNYRLDIFFVQYFLGFAQLGYYTLAVAIAELLWELPFSVSTALFQKVSSSSREDADRITPVMCRNTLFLMLILTGSVFLFGEIIIRIAYSQAFLPSVLPLKLLLPGVLVLSISKVLSGYLSGRGKPIYSTRAALVALSINVPLNFLLIPKWGIAGAAIASTISYAVQASVVIFFFVKVSNNTVLDTLIVKRDDFKVYRYYISEHFYGLATKRHLD